MTDIPNVAIGDEVVVWGKQGDQEIRVAEVAEWSETIPYEMLTTVGKRIPRTYIN
ncbi:MAG: alanine racemase C-terminal domain-containing protein [Candidatus Binatia bacterium]